MTTREPSENALARPAVRLAAFAAGLAVVFGVMFGIGTAVGPWDVDTTPSHGDHSTGDHSTDTVHEH